MTFLKSAWTLISDLMLGFVFISAIGLEWLKYWLHLGPKPTNEDFS